MKIKCVLVDDNHEGLALIRALVETERDMKVVKTFLSASSFLAQEKNLDYDAVFLDIQMPGMDGLQLAPLLEGKKIIFVSGHTERAFETYDVPALDFVPKPVKPQRLKIALDKLRQAMEKNPGYRFKMMATDKGKAMIQFQEIRFVTTCKHEPRDKQIIYKTGLKMVLKNIGFSELTQYLPMDDFFQPNRSMLFHTEILLGQPAVDLLLLKIPNQSNHIEVTLSDKYRQHFKERFGG